MYAGQTPSGGARPGRPPQRLGPTEPGPQPEDGTEAVPLELTLQPDVLTNVDDSAGRWQYARGRVRDHGAEVGVYASTSRLAVPGSGPHDDATLTLTIFFLGGTTPETITVHGSHDAGSGSESGTVSAASARHADRVGNRFRRAGDTVTID